MGNALTGDFDVVLQVSEATFQRVLASMHRNDHRNPDTPTIRHLTEVDVPDPSTPGKAVVHIAVPIITFLDGATDRVRLSVAIRALFTQAEGAPDPLPALIAGTVTADYVIATAAGRLTATVDRESVTFAGWTGQHFGSLEVELDAAPGRIEAIVAEVLSTQVVANSVAVDESFSLDQVVTRRDDDGAVLFFVHDVPGVGSPAATVSEGSTGPRLIGDQHLALAVSREVFVSGAQAALNAVVGGVRFHGTIDLGPAGTDQVDAALDVVEVRWGAPVVDEARVTVHLGAHIDPPLLLPFRVDAAQEFALRITDAGGFAVAPLGEAIVTTTVRGVDGLGQVLGIDDDSLTDIVAGFTRSQVEAWLPRVTEEANRLLGGFRLRDVTTPMGNQLRALDASADIELGVPRWDEDGLLVRGTVTLSPRKDWSVVFQTHDGGLDARATWVPGGGIEAYWWTVAGDPQPERIGSWTLPPEPGGGDLGTGRLTPGLDVTGTVHLVVDVFEVHPVTGEITRDSYTSRAREFYVDPRIIPVLPGAGRVKVSPGDLDDPGLDDPDFTTFLLSDLGTGGRSATSRVDGPNTVVVRAGPGSVGDLAERIRSGLDATAVVGTGVQVMVIAEAGRDEAWLSEATSTLTEAFAGVAPVSVFEDVDGDLAAGLGLPTEPGATWTALLSPQGGVPWAELGEVGGDALGAALDTFLLPAPPPRFVGLDREVRIAPDLTDLSTISAFDEESPS